MNMNMLDIFAINLIH